MDSDYFCIISSQKENLSEEKDEIINFYKKQVKTYDNVECFSYWDTLYKKYDILVDRYLTKHSIIVDVGCGTGLLSKKLASKKHSVFGIDISRDFLAMAKAKCNNQKNIFIKGIAEKIPLKNNVADSVICIETMDHIKNAELAICEMSRICKNKGIFIFDMTPYVTLDVYNALRHIYNFISQKNNSQKYHVSNWSMVNDNESKSTIKIYKHDLNHIEKILTKYDFSIIQKHGMHISSVVLFPENFQVINRSRVLFWLNNIFSKIDEKILNKVKFFQNKATCLICVCQKSSNIVKYE